MNNLSISKKSSLITVIVTLLMLVVGYIVLDYYKKNLTLEVYDSVQKDLTNLSKLKIQAKFDVGISNAISISNDGEIKKALQLREPLKIPFRTSNFYFLDFFKKSQTNSN